MDNLIFSINVVLPIFILMLIGVILKKVKLIDKVFIEKANDFAFKVLLPVLLFNNIYKSKISEVINLKLILFAVVINIVIVAILFITIPMIVKENKDKGIVIQGLFRSNFILFGVALSKNIFGEQNLGTVTTLGAIIIPLYNFLAVFILDFYSNDECDYKKTIVSVAKNPLIIGSFLGIAFSVLQIKVPGFMEKTISDIASTATPIALIVLGGDIEMKNISKNINIISYITVGKLLVIPSAVILLSVVTGFKGIELGALFSMVAPSVSVSSYTMAQQYNCNFELAGQLVFISTLISPFTIFMFIFILKTTGLF